MKINLALLLITACLCFSCCNSTSFSVEPLKDTSGLSKILSKSPADDHTNKNLPVVLKDARSAAYVAEIYMSNVYGKEQIANERPFLVSKYKDYWVIEGTLPKGYLGGVFSVVLDSRDGRIINYSHGK